MLNLAGKISLIKLELELELANLKIQSEWRSRQRASD